MNVLFTRSAEETARFARGIGQRLLPGDVILLDGPIGAGKTHFARALIQSLLIVPEHVPSPTFTLVQVYDTRRGALWHADLYRLQHPSEAEELGLSEAFDTAICLIEWPDRLGSLVPPDALRLVFASGPGEDDRQITVLPGGTWPDRLKDLSN